MVEKKSKKIVAIVIAVLLIAAVAYVVKLAVQGEFYPHIRPQFFKDSISQLHGTYMLNIWEEDGGSINDSPMLRDEPMPFKVKLSINEEPEFYAIYAGDFEPVSMGDVEKAGNGNFILKPDDGGDSMSLIAYGNTIILMDGDAMLIFERATTAPVFHGTGERDLFGEDE